MDKIRVLLVDDHHIVREGLHALLSAGLLAFVLAACGGATPTPTKSAVPAGTVKMNAHPASLEGKTVVLRWNSKPNGDKYLTRIGELLTQLASA